MMDLLIKPDDEEEYPLTITSRDILAWERVTKGMTFAKLQQDMNMGHIYNLAHRAATRRRLYSGSLEEFEAVTDIDIVADQEPVDPTNQGASTAP